MAEGLAQAEVREAQADLAGDSQSQASEGRRFFCVLRGVGEAEELGVVVIGSLYPADGEAFPCWRSSSSMHNSKTFCTFSALGMKRYGTI